MAEASTRKTFAVALLIAVGCAGLVSGMAVTLADRIQANKDRERMARILASAGVADAGAIDMRIVELDSGRYVDAASIGPGTFEQGEAAADPELSEPLAKDEDPAGLGRRERYAWVGLVRGEAGRIRRLILPIRGQGFGGMMSGFIVLGGDGTTVRSIRFTEQEETPGLGGEVASDRWREGWVGKRVYDDEGALRIEVVAGGAPAGQIPAIHRVDGISGATITSQSVSRIVRFWLGEKGFRPYLRRLAREGELDERAEAAEEAEKAEESR